MILAIFPPWIKIIVLRIILADVQYKTLVPTQSYLICKYFTYTVVKQELSLGNIEFILSSDPWAGATQGHPENPRFLSDQEELCYIALLNYLKGKNNHLLCRDTVNSHLSASNLLLNLQLDNFYVHTELASMLRRCENGSQVKWIWMLQGHTHHLFNLKLAIWITWTGNQCAGQIKI